MAVPIVVNVAEPWAIYEGQKIVDYIDLQGAPAGTGAGEIAPIAARFGRVPPWGSRPVLGWWATDQAKVTVSLTGDGVTTPWALVATAVAALTAGTKANAPVRIVYNVGSN